MVPLPRLLVDELARTVVTRPADELAVPSPQGAVLPNRNARSSLAIKAGANVKAGPHPADECGLIAGRGPVGGLARAPERGESAGQRSGDEGNRTPNPRLAKAVLCQLSYVPRRCCEPGLSVWWAC